MYVCQNIMWRMCEEGEPVFFRVIEEGEKEKNHVSSVKAYGMIHEILPKLRP